MVKKILIAEDDPGISEVTKIILDDAGFEAILIDPKKDVFETVKKTKPNLIIMDIWIADQNGIEITKKLKKDLNFKSIPIVIISAKQDIATLAKDSGADGYLPKPFDLSLLIETVNKYL